MNQNLTKTERKRLFKKGMQLINHGMTIEDEILKTCGLTKQAVAQIVAKNNWGPQYKALSPEQYIRNNAARQRPPRDVERARLARSRARAKARREALQEGNVELHERGVI